MIWLMNTIHIKKKNKNNTYHSTIKMKPVDLQSSKYIELVKKTMVKVLNLKMVMM